MLSFQDNVPVHSDQVAEAVKCGFELLPRHPYLPDLATSNLFPLHELNSHHHGPHLRNNYVIISAGRNFLRTKTLGWDCNAWISRRTILKKIEKLSCFYKSFCVRFRYFLKNLVYNVSFSLYVLILMTLCWVIIFEFVSLKLIYIIWSLYHSICGLRNSAFSFSIILVFYPNIIQSHFTLICPTSHQK